MPRPASRTRKPHKHWWFGSVIQYCSRCGATREVRRGKVVKYWRPGSSQPIIIGSAKSAKELRKQIITSLREELGRQPTEKEIDLSLKSIDEAMR